MDYWLKFFYGFIVTACLCQSVHASCRVSVESRSSCTYTVVCTQYVGSINSPGCSGNVNVTFIIQDILTHTLTSGVFSNTNFDSRVRYFFSINNSFNYIEKYALKYYRYVTYVDMSQNNINVIEKGAFLDLIQMKYLNLSHNSISDLSNETLQVSFIQNSALEILDLSNNHILQLDNDVFSYSINLKQLYLENNRIKTMSDTCFNNLKSLEYLILRNNSISSLNMALVLLRELKYLDISQNHITKLFSYETPGLSTLLHFNISYNHIESVDRASFYLLPKLELLDMSYNQIQSPIDKDMFANNHQLKYLDLYRNNLTTISPTVFLNNNISYLNVEKNNITGDITNDTLRGLGNLTELNITHQHIEGIKNNAFSEMVKLQYLNLSYNSIKSIDNSSFVNASSLIILDVSHNQINNIFFVKMFTSNLSEMYLNNNHIMTVPEKVFENHSKLKNLDVSDNMIVKIDQNALPLNNLQFLGIIRNNLSGVAIDRVFSPAKLLRNLDLSNFHLTKLNDSALVDIPLVARLNLSHNDLDYIHPTNFKGVDNMYSLDISFNKLKNVVLDKQLTNLKSINLNNNNFTRIPNMFGNESKLEYLDISFNNISNITDPTLKNIHNLKVLHITHNKLTYFNNEYTNALVHLIELSLASNEMKEMINISYYKDLESVNISDNQITSINASHFSNLPSLKLLSLSGNKLKTLEPSTFQNLEPLFLLDLSSNYLTNLRFGVFRGLNNTKVINLSRNKITSLKGEVFHECPELNVLIIDYNYITGINIKTLSMAAPKLKLLSIGGNPIACEEVIQTKKTGKQVLDITVTSLHKIFHQDNVHGIKCGDNDTDDTVKVTTNKPTEVPQDISGVSTGNILIVWCTVLIIVALVGFASFYVLKRKKTLGLNRESRIQLRNSSVVTQSECYNDLLG